MSIGSVYETAYKGDYNQVKVKVDQEKSLVTTPDEVSLLQSAILEILLHIFFALLSLNEPLDDSLLDTGLF